ncbi:hypothetical protein FRB90_006794 [Tulasnella sp. 427]|nr:hypothetical protein FRB90_006794 [Tulasnella sp. 427]
MMPLSSNMFVHVEDAKPASTQQAAPSQRRSWLSEDSRLNFLVMVESIKSAVLHGLELVSLYNRRAERDLREMNDRNRAAVSASEIPDAPLDPTLPRELVTGVMILMPSRGKLESWEEDQLPDVAIGVKDKEWKGRIDVDGPSVVA